MLYAMNIIIKDRKLGINEVVIGLDRAIDEGG